MGRWRAAGRGSGQKHALSTQWRGGGCVKTGAGEPVPAAGSGLRLRRRRGGAGEQALTAPGGSALGGAANGPALPGAGRGGRGAGPQPDGGRGTREPAHTSPRLRWAGRARRGTNRKRLICIPPERGGRTPFSASPPPLRARSEGWRGGEPTRVGEPRWERRRRPSPSARGGAARVGPGAGRLFRSDFSSFSICPVGFPPRGKPHPVVSMAAEGGAAQAC